VCAGGAHAVVWETQELQAVSAAFLTMLKRQAATGAMQAEMYATLAGAHLQFAFRLMCMPPLHMSTLTVCTA
jgi:hypothetical protein